MKEKTLSSRKIFSGHVISLKSDKVKIGKSRISTREVVLHNGAVAILPVLKNDKLVLVKQFRYAVGKTTLEIPAGTLKKNENPLFCAKRELKEETGYTSGKIRKILSFYTTPGFSNEILHIYLAEDLKAGKKELEWDENVKTEYVSLTKALKMIKCGLVRDGKTIIAILMYEMMKVPPRRD